MCKASRTVVLTVGLAALSMLGGCWSSKPPEVETPITSPPGTPGVAVVPVVTQTPEQIREEMRPLDPFSSQFADSRLKLEVLLDKARKEHGVEGFEQRESPPVAEYSSPTVRADPETKRVAWRAMTCFNPECTGKGRGGGPFLFTLEYSWVTVGPDGKLVIGQPNIEEMNRPVYCPACKSNNYIQTYDLPESAAREKVLTEELKQVYAAYAEASLAHREKPAGMRPPEVIVKEIEALPKLYLLSEPGKVKPFDAITAPISGGK